MKENEKQAIEEMSKVIEGTEKVALDSVGVLPSPTMYAKDLYWQGYRKQSDVIMETLAELEKILRFSDKDGCLKVTGLYSDYAEFKKKYTESETNG